MRIEKKEEEEKKDGVVGKEKILALDIFTSHLGWKRELEKKGGHKRTISFSPSLHVSSKTSSLGLGPKSKYQGLHNAEGLQLTFLWF